MSEVAGTSTRSGLQEIVLRVINSSEGKAGLILGGLIAVIALVGPFVAPFDPTELGAGDPLDLPSWQHLLGTDTLGRDVFSRVLHGGREIFILPFIGILAAFMLGGTIGLFSAYTRGAIDALLVRIVDIILSFPTLLLLLIIIAGIGSSSWSVLLGVIIAYTPRAFLTVRASASAVVRADYVLSAQAAGERLSWIMYREILPNIIGPVIADFALRVTYAIMFVATLSFLGLGAQPPSSNWGLMIAEARTYLVVNPFGVLAPAAGIAALSVATNLVADSLARAFSRGGSQ